MSRDVCAKPGCGQSRDHAFHVWYQQATSGHRFVEPAESSDEATVREIAAYWAISTKPARVPGFRMKDDAVDKMIDLGMEGCAKAAFTAGRAAALDVMDNERKDFMKAISIHIDAANQWRLRFKRLAQAFGLEWRKGQDVEDFIADAISRAGGTTK